MSYVSKAGTTADARQFTGSNGADIALWLGAHANSAHTYIGPVEGQEAVEAVPPDENGQGGVEAQEAVEAQPARVVTSLKIRLVDGDPVAVNVGQWVVQVDGVLVVLDDAAFQERFAAGA